MSKAIFTGASDPATPASGKVIVFARADGQMYSMDDTGTVTALSLPATQAQILGGFTDLEFSVVSSEKGPSAPTLSAFGPSGRAKQRSFIIGNSVYTTGHINHDIKPGSICYPHVHWSTNGVNLNTAKFQLDFTIAAGHNQANFPIDQQILLEEAAHGTAWRHMITEDPTGIIAPEVDSLIIITLERITNGGTDNTDLIFPLYVDFHVEVDRYATPNRLVPFYT